jgi:hypothetical protein
MTKLIKYTVEHFRKEGVTEEAFEKFFTEVHVPTALALFQKYGIMKYSVVCTQPSTKNSPAKDFRVQQRRLPELGAQFEPMLKSIHPTWEVSKADTVIQYWMPDLECLMKVVTDPEWEAKAVKGQDEFIDVSRGTTHLAVETTYLEDGKVLGI